MNEVNSYKKLRGRVITVTCVVLTKTGDRYTEYIQGVLHSVDDIGIEIEQYLSLFDYLDGSNPPSKIRRFGFRDITFLGNLPA
ncbi:hypothetical protein [Flavobacterium cerinum]|uniref:Uncharacterized protein n=1 Tax=Flavobacterium cerinum TaxID=2502784 RepID=A0A3S3Q9J6_9FLAO|nr:hypothetical protein [Flavobacterium cerinum]RWX00993.1 hypothetical protein EPI11_08200 [Flavobacterium cerinum]